MTAWAGRREPDAFGARGPSTGRTDRKARRGSPERSAIRFRKLLVLLTVTSNSSVRCEKTLNPVGSQFKVSHTAHTGGPATSRDNPIRLMTVRVQARKWWEVGKWFEVGWDKPEQALPQDILDLFK